MCRVLSRLVFLAMFFLIASSRFTPVWLAIQVRTQSTSAISSPKSCFSPSLKDWSPCSRHDSRHFAYFFGKTCHVCEFTEISHSVLLYPGINLCLKFLKSHDYSLFLVSMQIVTGPSLSNSTFMSAPNVPVLTGFSISLSIASQNFS